MTPDALKVLSDVLREALPERDAEDLIRWAQHPDAVRRLIEHQRLTEGGRCVACGMLSGRDHAEDCVLLEATERLDITWHSPVHELDRAHEEALQQAAMEHDASGN